MKHMIFILAIGTIGWQATAQQLGLNEAVNIALKNSLDIELSKNNVDINTINNNIGVAGGLPFVQGSASNQEQLTSVNQKLNSGTVIHRNNAAGNTLNANVTGSFLLYNGMRVVATKKRLKELELQSKELLNSQVQNVMASVMTGYYDVVRQQSYLKTIDESISLSEQRLTIVKAQQSVGLANNADLFQAEVDLNNLKQTKESQLLIIAQVKTELLRLMSLRPDSTISIQDTILVDNSLRLEEVMNNLANNADIRAADDQIRINEFIVRETAARRYPSLNLNSGISYGRTQAAAGNFLLNQNYGPFVGLGLTVPIYNGSIYKRQVRVAEINTKNAALQKDMTVRDYSSNAVKTYQSYASTLAQLEFQRNNFNLAQQLLSLALQRFQLRQATLVEVRQAQESFEQAGYTVVNLSFAAKSAEIELKRLINKIAL